METVKVPIWQKTWFVVLACIFIPPAGIALLWIGKKEGLALRIVLTVFLGFYSLGWLGSLFSGGSDTTITEKPKQVTEETVVEKKTTADTKTVEEEKAVADKAATDKAAAEAKAIEDAKPKETMGQKNALKKADSYLSFSGFSHSSLIEQLEFEGFSIEDSTYAADNCGADWNEQAAKKAKSYLDFTSFSRSGLIEQLLYEGFFQEQAEHGVSAVGY